MKNFLEYLKEVLNTKTYKWIESDFLFRKIAYFKTESKRQQPKS